MVRSGLHVLLVALLCGIPAYGQSKFQDLRQEASRAAAVEALRAESLEAEARARAWAEAAGLPRRGRTADGRGYELIALDSRGRALYYLTENANAAISTNVHLIRNTAPYNLDGSGITIGLWDEGAALPTHQELAGRIVVGDGAATSEHSTHVAGTLGASGVQPAARGMAPGLLIDSYNWSLDTSEMTARAAASATEAGGIFLSNHSYGQIAGWEQGDFSGVNGFHWFGLANEREDRDFGLYTAKARDWDDLCYNAPYYLIFKSAGNDRDNPAPPVGAPYFYQTFDPQNPWGLRSYDPAVDPHPDGWKGGYDTIAAYGTAKNVLTVGAVGDAVVGGARNLGAAAMTSFSGWGPSDDGRIKPDLVANGVQLYSCLGSSDTAYGNSSGTSMATPNAAGAAALLVEYFNRLFPGEAMLGSTLKGLLIHTADDLGNPGPDYSFGWGLVNAAAAAEHVRAHAEESLHGRMVEARLDGGNPSRSYALFWDGVSPIVATLCWTDPAGVALNDLNNPSPRLVNDLDLRILGPGGAPTYLPYAPDPNNPAGVAGVGDNARDNVEQVRIAAPGMGGTYTVQVSHKGALSGGQQDFSLLLSGLVGAPPTPTPTPTPSFTPTPTPTPTETGTPTPTATFAPASGPPRWFAPQVVGLPADSGVHAALAELSQYVEDDNTPPSGLLFSLVSQSDPGVVAVAVTGSGTVSADVQPGRVGRNRVVFRVRDASGNEADTTVDFQVMGATLVPQGFWRLLD